MSRGDQRERDRARAEKRNAGKGPDNKHTKKSDYVQNREK